MLIYIIEDDPDWQNVYKNLLDRPAQTAVGRISAREGDSQAHPPEDSLPRSIEKIHTQFFPDGVSAMAAIDEQLPDAILLDMLLAGPSAPALLAELQSYPDTASIPIALITGITTPSDMSDYGITAIFDKATVTPQEILAWISKQEP